MTRAGPAEAPRWGVILAVGLAVTLAALALRLTGIGSGHVTLDEVYTQFAVSRDWWGMISERAGRGHMPGYFAAVKALGIDVADIAALRRPSAVFDALAAGVLTAALGRFAGWRAGLWAGLLYACAPALIHWGQSARPYGLLMLFIMIGLAGAMALVRSASAAEARWGTRLFAMGWSGAALTLTGGIFAFLAVAVLPWVRGGPLRDAAFRHRWRRALRWPLGVAVFAYLAVSSSQVYEGFGGYWVDRYRPFGLPALWELLEDLVGGRLRESVDWLTGPLAHWAMAAAAVLLVALTLHGATRARDVRALWPVIALTLGYSVILLASSITTSLLIDRYFLPAWAGVLALAGIGLARLQPVPQGVLAVPLLAASLAVGWVAAKAPSSRTETPLAEIARVIETSGQGDLTVLVSGDVYLDLRREILSLRFDDPTLRRPEVRGATPERITEQLEKGAPFVLVLREAEWESPFAGYIPLAECTRRADPFLMTRIGGGCPAPMGNSGTSGDN